MILFAAPPNVIELTDDDADVPLRPRRNKKASARKTSQSIPAAEPVVQQPEDVSRASVTFTDPVSRKCPTSSTVPVLASTVQLHSLEFQADVSGPSVPFFTTHHVPKSWAEAAAEAIRQASIMMEGVKVMHENSQAAYDASAALRANVQVSWLPTELVMLGYAT